MRNFATLLRILRLDGSDVVVLVSLSIVIYVDSTICVELIVVIRLPSCLIRQEARNAIL